MDNSWDEKSTTLTKLPHSWQTNVSNANWQCISLQYDIAKKTILLSSVMVVLLNNWMMLLNLKRLRLFAHKIFARSGINYFSPVLHVSIEERCKTLFEAGITDHLDHKRLGKAYEVNSSGEKAPKGWRRYPTLDWTMERELAGKMRFEEWKLKGEKCC
ncbi:MAG: hypothetical protein SVW57_02740 [Thermodesulfobacteriota bacterium]|nr:hypothetical protein [Thermodesulfobacteriota bacterium]